MPIELACPNCAQQYRLPDAAAGKKVKCKVCTAPIAVPRGEPSPEDIYGLDDELQPAAANRKAAADDKVDGGFSAPTRSGERKRKPQSWAASGANQEQFRRAGIGLLIVGVATFLLPFVGLQLKGLHKLGTAGQIIGGVAILVAGVLCLVASSQGLIKALLMVAVPGTVVLSATAWLTNRGAVNAVAAGAPAGPPLGFPGPAPGFPGQPGVAPGSFHTPADSVKITLSNGRISDRTTPFGTPTPGVEISVDYQVVEGMAVGAKFKLVVRSRHARGELVSFHLRPSGTLSAESPTASKADGPYEVFVEAESFAGRNARVVSNTLALQWVDAPPAQDTFANRGVRPGDIPRAGIPPGVMPPPGLPPGVGPRGLPAGVGPRGGRFGRPGG